MSRCVRLNAPHRFRVQTTFAISMVGQKTTVPVKGRDLPGPVIQCPQDSSCLDQCRTAQFSELAGAFPPSPDAVEEVASWAKDANLQPLRVGHIDVVQRVDSQRYNGAEHIRGFSGGSHCSAYAKILHQAEGVSSAQSGRIRVRDNNTSTGERVDGKPVVTCIRTAARTKDACYGPGQEHPRNVLAACPPFPTHKAAQSTHLIVLFRLVRLAVPVFWRAERWVGYWCRN